MLIVSLNQLLGALGLPYVLETASDLTPTLLLAILACLLRTPLISVLGQEDLDDTINTLADLTNDHNHDLHTVQDDAADDDEDDGHGSQGVSDGLRARLPPSRHEKAHRQIKQMKLLLGVLENDVLTQDLGLSDVDPRRLARGEKEEVEYVAELFVWLGRQKGFLPSSSSLGTVDPILTAARTANRRRSLSPAATTNTASMEPTNLSLNDFTPSINADTTTSPPSTIRHPRSRRRITDDKDNSTPRLYPRFVSEEGPQCIHEVDFGTLDDIPPTPILRPRRPSPQPSEISFSHRSVSTTATYRATPCEYTTCYCSAASVPHLRPATPPVTPSTHGGLTPGIVDNVRLPVRRQGCISPVDEEAEIASFEASRHMLSPMSLGMGGGGSLQLPSSTPLLPRRIEASSPFLEHSVGATRTDHDHEDDLHFSLEKLVQLKTRKAILLGEIALAWSRYPSNIPHAQEL